MLRRLTPVTIIFCAGIVGAVGGWLASLLLFSDAFVLTVIPGIVCGAWFGLFFGVGVARLTCG
jgi:hypothetical protein